MQSLIATLSPRNYCYYYNSGHREVVGVDDGYDKALVMHVVSFSTLVKVGERLSTILVSCLKFVGPFQYLPKTGSQTATKCCFCAKTHP